MIVSFAPSTPSVSRTTLGLTPTGRTHSDTERVSSAGAYADCAAGNAAAAAAAFGSPFTFAPGSGGAGLAGSPHTPSPVLPAAGSQHTQGQQQQQDHGLPGAAGLSGQITPDLMALLQHQSRQIESLTSQVADLQRRLDQPGSGLSQVSLALPRLRGAILTL